MYKDAHSRMVNNKKNKYKNRRIDEKFWNFITVTYFTAMKISELSNDMGEI